MTEASRMQLSPEQQKVLGSWGQGLAVMAGAGSGKTTTLVMKCAELLNRDPKAKFAAVSFTERSASDLRAKLSRKLSLQGERGALSGHWVMTIHGLCGAIIREFPREAGFDGEESMLSEGESGLLWERALEALWMEELPEPVKEAFEAMLRRESRDSLHALLKRARGLHSFGLLERMAAAESADSRSLSTLARFAMERYDRLKRRRGALDFDDLERGADRALEFQSVRAAFHRRFDLVLIDEFQDTNPLQARILWRFARPDASNLCVVGDPKQSIYRFRDADVSVFEECCAKLPIRLSLTWNFRSRPGIIDYANRICAQAFEDSGMAYEPLVARRERSPEDEALRLDVQGPADLARWVQAEVARGIPLHEMALLLRKIRGNETWLKALTSSGIPIALGSGGLFWDDPRIRELTAFLRWWDNPANSLAAAVFLRSPWVGVADADLDEWIKRDRTCAKPFFEESGHPIAAALAPLRGKPVRPGEVLMALLVSQEVEAEVGSPLLGLWHRAEELSSGGLDFHAVVCELSAAMTEGRRDRDVPPPRNEGQLSVLTLHGSKGLEFPHVILIDFGKKPRGGDMPLLFWDRARGAYLATRDEDGDREKDHPVEAEWREEEKRKNLAESKRLFYVALTRARERLVLVCPALEKADFDPQTAFTQDYWRAWIETETEIARARLPELVPVSKPDKPAAEKFVRRRPPAPALKRPRHSVTEWNLLSRCPRAYEWTYVRPVQVADGVAEIGLFTGDKVATLAEQELTQRELGTRVHGCLERGDFDGLKMLEMEAGAARFQAEPIISWAMSSAWMAPADSGRDRDVWTELSFEVPVGGEVLVGSIDRLVRQGSTFALIDFKVTERAKSVESLLESYRAQMELYAWALQRIEPEIAGSTLESLLVNISPKAIQAIPVQAGAIEPEAIARNAGTIVAGEPGAPKPGALCRHCEFKSICPEALRPADF